MQFSFEFGSGIRIIVPVRNLMIEEPRGQFGMVESLLGIGKAVIFVYFVVDFVSERFFEEVILEGLLFFI